MLPRKPATFLIAFLALACNAFADVQLPGIIIDHMLLQRDMPVRIFGKAQPGEAVSVAFRGQTAQTVTDAVGRWEVWLQPLPARLHSTRGDRRYVRGSAHAFPPGSAGWRHRPAARRDRSPASPRTAAGWSRARSRQPALRRSSPLPSGLPAASSALPAPGAGARMRAPGHGRWFPAVCWV